MLDSARFHAGFTRYHRFGLPSISHHRRARPRPQLAARPIRTRAYRPDQIPSAVLARVGSPVPIQRPSSARPDAAGNLAESDERERCRDPPRLARPGPAGKADVKSHRREDHPGQRLTGPPLACVKPQICPIHSAMVGMPTAQRKIGPRQFLAYQRDRAAALAAVDGCRPGGGNRMMMLPLTASSSRRDLEEVAPSRLLTNG